MIIQKSKNYWGLDISKVEKKYNAVYIGDFALKTKSGGWSDRPASIFWQKHPNRSLGHSNYFSIFGKIGFNNEEISITSLYITKGDSTFSEDITGLKMANGNILISGWVHDYNENYPYFIDGGRDYFRTSGIGEIVKLYIDGPELKEYSLVEIEKNLDLAENDY